MQKYEWEHYFTKPFIIKSRKNDVIDYTLTINKGEISFGEYNEKTLDLMNSSNNFDIRFQEDLSLNHKEEIDFILKVKKSFDLSISNQFLTLQNTEAINYLEDYYRQANQPFGKVTDYLPENSDSTSLELKLNENQNFNSIKEMTFEDKFEDSFSNSKNKEEIRTIEVPKDEESLFFDDKNKKSYLDNTIFTKKIFEKSEKEKIKLNIKKFTNLAINQSDEVDNSKFSIDSLINLVEKLKEKKDLKKKKKEKFVKTVLDATRTNEATIQENKIDDNQSVIKSYQFQALNQLGETQSLALNNRKITVNSTFLKDVISIKNELIYHPREKSQENKMESLNLDSNLNKRITCNKSSPKIMKDNLSKNKVKSDKSQRFKKFIDLAMVNSYKSDKTYKEIYLSKTNIINEKKDKIQQNLKNSIVSTTDNTNILIDPKKTFYSRNPKPSRFDLYISKGKFYRKVKSCENILKYI